jgi:hypothetical protein
MITATMTAAARTPTAMKRWGRMLSTSGTWAKNRAGTQGPVRWSNEQTTQTASTRP